MHDPKILNPNTDSTTSHLNLTNLGDEIMSIWEGRVRTEVDSAGDLLRPALRDALPKFLGLLAEALSEKDSRGLIETGSNLVRQHAGERARDTGFGPSQVVQEFQVLKEAVTSRLEKEMNLSPIDYETIQKTFDQAKQEALMEFFLVHAELKEQFTATLSHDLRNPIGVAKMGAELIQDIAMDIQDSTIRDDLIGLSNRIVTNLKRADRMIQDLLDASVLKIGQKPPITISKCDLLTITHDVIADIDEREKNRLQIIGRSTIGYWDRDGLKRSLENLVKNSIKYGTPRTPITIQITKTNSHVRLSVHNQGNPISEHDRKLIFLPFNRSKSVKSGANQGWGIGLALVRAVSESLGGSTTVESSEQDGTIFFIDLPLDSRPFQLSSSRTH